MANPTLPVYLRPLSIVALDEELPVNILHEPGDLALHLLSDLTKEQQTPLDFIRKRYRDITNEAKEPIIVPHHEVIIQHVIRPLREAKQCFVLGMPVACIAQAGLVGEMVALWRFRMLQPHPDGRPLDETLQKLLLGREFDRLGQKERIRILKAVDNLDEEIVSAFTNLRLLRRKYLHFMVDAQTKLDEDAKQALLLAHRLVTKTLGVTFDQGAMVLPPRVFQYIQDIVSREPSPPGAGPVVSST